MLRAAKEQRHISKYYGVNTMIDRIIAANKPSEERDWLILIIKTKIPVSHITNSNLDHCFNRLIEEASKEGI